VTQAHGERIARHHDSEDHAGGAAPVSPTSSAPTATVGSFQRTGLSTQARSRAAAPAVPSAAGVEMEACTAAARGAVVTVVLPVAPAVGAPPGLGADGLAPMPVPPRLRPWRWHRDRLRYRTD